MKLFCLYFFTRSDAQFDRLESSDFDGGDRRVILERVSLEALAFYAVKDGSLNRCSLLACSILNELGLKIVNYKRKMVSQAGATEKSPNVKCPKLKTGPDSLLQV